jgi:LPS sulfotransferase NodH
LRLARLLQAERNWRDFFHKETIQSINCIYEDIVLDPQAAIDRLARTLGLPDRALIAPDQVTLRIQRDGVSDAWRERFMAEARVADPAIWAFCQTLDVATSARYQT